MLREVSFKKTAIESDVPKNTMQGLLAWLWLTHQVPLCKLEKGIPPP